MVDYAYVHIWNYRVGAVAWDSKRNHAVFEFGKEFIKSGLDIAPLTMPLDELQRGNLIFSFPALGKETFRGLPGLLADSLPDRYGNLLIDAWLSRQGRPSGSFSPVERLCYMGKRSTGALEFEPVLRHTSEKGEQLEIHQLVKLAQKVLENKEKLNVFLDKDTEYALEEIIKVGTSAGGARAKAVIAMNDETGEIRSGQVEVPDGFGHWIMKFDGVEDIQFGETRDFGRIEYAYNQMAKDAGINVPEFRLLEENGRAHFLTKRFDRLEGNVKIHMQSLCGIAHYDYNLAGGYSWEQAFEVMRRLRLPYSDAEELYRRMCFNHISRNLDDHSKNISFLMNSAGSWRLSPAYDIIYSYNKDGIWTSKHQMTINGKRENVTDSDLLIVGKKMNIKQPQRILEIIKEIVSRWRDYAKASGLNKQKTEEIFRNLDLG